MSRVKKEHIDGFKVNILGVLSDDSPSEIEVPVQSQHCAGTDEDEHPLLQGKKLTTVTDDKPGLPRTNIVYLNTDCNLRCEYCYEKDSRNGLEDHANCSTQMIDGFINEIENRERGLNSCITVMGGEPTLKWDLYEYLVTSLMTKPKTEGWSVQMTTNALLFNSQTLIDKYINLQNAARDKNVHISLEVSYDGSGHYRRKIKGSEKDSINLVESAIEKLIQNDVQFALSYTVHMGNYKNVTEDLIKICEKWGSHCRKISLSIAYEDLDGVHPGYAMTFKQQIKPYCKSIYKIYKIGICDLVCSLCQVCNRNSAGNAYLSPTTGISYDDKSTSHEFQQF